jgi:tol-pal system protein YbgF
VIPLPLTRHALSRVLSALAVVALFAAPQVPAWAQEAPKPKAQGGESSASRIERLEGQFVDLQVMVGTLESLLRSGPAPQQAPMTPAPPSISGADSGEVASRVSALETQITALTAQLEQMARQLNAMQGQISGVPLPPMQQNEGPGRQGDAGSANATAAFEEQNPGTSFSTQTIPNGGAAPGTPPGGSQAHAWPESLTPLPSDVESGTVQPQSLTAAIPASDSKALYEQGYGSLMQRDYEKAEAAFREFVSSYPSDPLAGNAQYWIGESYYQRGRYKDAADAFLKGYKSYRSNQKAADSLLKLGMSLAALGQKDAACSSFDELKTKYPAAEDDVRQTAASERKKAGC